MNKQINAIREALHEVAQYEAYDKKHDERRASRVARAQGAMSTMTSVELEEGRDPDSYVGGAEGVSHRKQVFDLGVAAGGDWRNNNYDKLKKRLLKSKRTGSLSAALGVAAPTHAAWKAGKVIGKKGHPKGSTEHRTARRAAALGDFTEDVEDYLVSEGILNRAVKKVTGPLRVRMKIRGWQRDARQSGAYLGDLTDRMDYTGDKMAKKLKKLGRSNKEIEDYRNAVASEKSFMSSRSRAASRASDLIRKK